MLNTSKKKKHNLKAKLKVCVSQQTGKLLKRWEYLYPEKIYSGQEATVRTRHGTMDWFQIGKEEHQGCIMSSCLFNLHAE